MRAKLKYILPYVPKVNIQCFLLFNFRLNFLAIYGQSEFMQNNLAWDSIELRARVEKDLN